MEITTMDWCWDKNVAEYPYFAFFISLPETISCDDGENRKKGKVQFTVMSIFYNISYNTKTKVDMKWIT